MKLKTIRNLIIGYVSIVSLYNISGWYEAFILLKNAGVSSLFSLLGIILNILFFDLPLLLIFIYLVKKVKWEERE